MYTVSNRTPLDRSRVIAAGVAFADAHGLDALSMRSLAADLGVVPMALYKHIADKDDLVGAIVDRVVAGYDTPPEQLVGTPAVRARIHSARAALAAHPWLRAAIESRRTPTPAVLDHQNALAGDLLAGGYSIDLTHHALHALGHRIWGFNPEAFSGTPAEPPTPEVVAAMAARYPNVVAIAQDAAIRSGLGACDDDAEFDFTLDLLLDAFERLRAAGWESRPVSG